MFFTADFGSKEGLFREAVEDNIKTRLELLEAHTVSAKYEGARQAAIQRLGGSDCDSFVSRGAGNSILTNWALLEDPEYAAEVYRNEIGSVEIVWNREFVERFPEFAASRRILSVHLVPYAVSACVAYGFWLATLRHDAQSAAALAQGFRDGDSAGSVGPAIRVELGRLLISPFVQVGLNEL